MKRCLLILLIMVQTVFFMSCTEKSNDIDTSKLRVIMMSDFPPIGVVKGGDDVPNSMKSDPDDMQSMVRFLLYANEFEIEGLVAAAGTFAMEAHKKNMLEVLDKYEMVYENLKKYDSDYPTADYLRSVTYEGLGNNHGLSIRWGKNDQPWSDIIGEDLDSEASNAIIAAVDKPDPRPLWIGVWGGAREVAQAIWRVQTDRSEEELKTFISKLRIFLIYYQDATHGWLMNEFPELFIIDSRKTYQGMFGGDDPDSDLAWINEHIRFNHGPLGEVYPHEGMGCTGVCEGDSPTFLYLVSANRGINDSEDPTQPSWGGQYVRKENTNHYIDGPGGSSIAMWRKDYQKEFKERADWMLAPRFVTWLKSYIPAEYPDLKVDDYDHWFQAKFPDSDQIVSWAELPEESIALNKVEGLYEGKSLFINKELKDDWADVSEVEYYEGSGYHILAYSSETMGDWDVGKLTVVQFDGDSKMFAKEMAKAWEKAQD